MLKKIITFLFAILFIAGSFSMIHVQQAEATSLPSFKVNIISADPYPDSIPLKLQFPRKFNGATYNHLLGKSIDNNKVIGFEKSTSSKNSWFRIVPKQEGIADFAVGIYHYDSGATDGALFGIIEFHVVIEKDENGLLYVANQNDKTFAKYGWFSTRDNVTQRYKYTSFKKMTIANSSGEIKFTCTNTAKKDTDITTLIKKYSLSKYYRINGSHVHQYSDGKTCDVCGTSRYSYLGDAEIPSIYYKIDAPKKGTLRTVKPRVYDSSTKTYKVYGLPVQVYLPYGYDSSKKYNVVFLVPGSDGTITNWMGDNIQLFVPGGKTYGKLSGKRLFDWLIYTGQSEPFIAVSLDMKPYNGSYSETYSRHVNFITKYWLPMIIDGQGVYTDSNKKQQIITFGGTYAKSSKEADIVKAKDHFIIGGLSQGAIFVCNYAANPTSPLGKRFGHKIIMSTFTAASVVEKNYKKDKNNKDKLYYISGGKNDKSGGGASSYNTMMEYVKKNSDGSYKYPHIGKFPIYIYNSAHKWYTWFRGFATVMQEIR